MQDPKEFKPVFEVLQAVGLKFPVGFPPDKMKKEEDREKKRQSHKSMKY